MLESSQTKDPDLVDQELDDHDDPLEPLDHLAREVRRGSGTWGQTCSMGRLKAPACCK